MSALLHILILFEKMLENDFCYSIFSIVIDLIKPQRTYVNM